MASVSGAYRMRHGAGANYLAWNRPGEFLTGGAGEEFVVGNGFGCVLLRTSVARQAVIQNAAPTADFDPNFYQWLSGTPWRAKLNWTIECAHLSKNPD